MKGIFIVIYLTIVVGVFTISTPSFAQPMCPDCQMWRNQDTYGNYCSGPKWGWYGAKKSVRTADEIKKILQEYFKNEPIVIGNIKEMKWFFEAEIKDKNNNLLDMVIVDKRTGRIRSIY